MYLKLSNLLKTLAFKLKQKSLYFELEHYIKNDKSYLKKIHCYDRGIGKTYTLIKLAHKYNCPIVTRYRYYRKNTSIPMIVVTDDLKQFLGIRYDLLLIDEGFDTEFINNVIKPMCKTLVGFVDEEYSQYNNH